jgi:hypothetical protein
MIKITTSFRATLVCDKCEVTALSLVYDSKPRHLTLTSDFFGKKKKGHDWLCPKCKAVG